MEMGSMPFSPDERSMPACGAKEERYPSALKPLNVLGEIPTI